jgi:predicted nuclease of predicted toxin-antitoxin system
MKLLLDENLPIKLKFRFLEQGMETYTTRDMHWLGKKNGELLKLMLAQNFSTFITIDNNLNFQQNFQNYPLNVAVIIAKDNTYDTIMEFFDSIVIKLKQEFDGVISIVHPNYK